MLSAHSLAKGASFLGRSGAFRRRSGAGVRRAPWGLPPPAAAPAVEGDGVGVVFMMAVVAEQQ